MKKILEGLKRFGVWLKKPLAFIKKWWGKFVTLVRTPEWVFIFPASVFAVVAFFTWSIVMVIVLTIWVITIACNKKKDI